MQLHNIKAALMDIKLTSDLPSPSGKIVL